MTNQERAEKIRIELIKLGSWADVEQIDKIITSQLDEAVREALKEVEVIRVINLAERDVQNFEDGFASAREKAAGIAVQIGHYDGSNVGTSLEADRVSVQTGNEIAERIRAMVPEEDK